MVSTVVFNKRACKLSFTGVCADVSIKNMNSKKNDRKFFINNEFDSPWFISYQSGGKSNCFIDYCTSAYQHSFAEKLKVLLRENWKENNV